VEMKNSASPRIRMHIACSSALPAAEPPAPACLHSSRFRGPGAIGPSAATGVAELRLREGKSDSSGALRSAGRAHR